MLSSGQTLVVPEIRVKEEAATTQLPTMDQDIAGKSAPSISSVAPLSQPLPQPLAQIPSTQPIRRSKRTVTRRLPNYLIELTSTLKPNSSLNKSPSSSPLAETFSAPKSRIVKLKRKIEISSPENPSPATSCSSPIGNNFTETAVSPCSSTKRIRFISKKMEENLKSRNQRSKKKQSCAKKPQQKAMEKNKKFSLASPDSTSSVSTLVSSDDVAEPEISKHRRPGLPMIPKALLNPTVKNPLEALVRSAHEYYSCILSPTNPMIPYVYQNPKIWQTYIATQFFHSRVEDLQAAVKVTGGLVKKSEGHSANTGDLGQEADIDFAARNICQYEWECMKLGELQIEKLLGEIGQI